MSQLNKRGPFRLRRDSVSKSNRRRWWRGERLEDRNLLAADLWFSEIAYEVDFNSDFDDKYFEIRGTPNSTIPQGTYMVVVDADGNDTRKGEVNSRFNLSGLTLGSNGYLVISQGPAVYGFDPDSTALVGTNDFRGLPTGVYHNETSVSAGFEHVFGSNSFLLIESATTPGVNTDYDTDDDGVLDGNAANWDIIDGVSINGEFLDGDPDDAVYGNILFRIGGNQSIAPAGVETIDLDRGGYVARIGDRTGNTQDDWVAGNVDLASDDLGLDIQTESGNEVYRKYVGSRLDHQGGPNFFTTVSGTKFIDQNNNGVRDGFESGVSGVQMYLDVNNNGERDNFQVHVEPDDLADGLDITKISPVVSLTREDDDGTMRPFAPRVTEDIDVATTGTRRFDAGFDVLRMEFATPIQSVSLDATNLDSSFGDTAGMEAYDAAGNLLATYSTGVLVNSFETMTISRASADISMVRAFFDPIHSSVSQFDNLRFSLPEPSATTDENGDYRIENVDLHVAGPSTVTLRTVGQAGGEQLFLDRALTIGGIDSPTRLDDILGRTDNGEWWIADSDGSSFNTQFFGRWSGTANWENSLAGDVDGDGITDVMGRVGREWWVSTSNGNSLDGALFWGVWPTVASWDNVTVVDVNGDGLSDIVGRNDGGAWWVARSTGSYFVMEQWSHWSTNVTWDDVSIGDFNGDGLDDIAGRVNGTWFVDVSNGQQFEFQQWGAWSNAVTWDDVRVGDFDGDGRDDIAGRTNGQWWLAHSTGTSFTTEYWGRWSNAVTWEDVLVADFDGDGREDIAGRTNGQWWLAHSTGSFFTVEYWGRWSTAVTWEDVQVGDFDGDGRDDIAGRANGYWWLAHSAGSFFTVEYWGQWSATANWEAVLVGSFSASSAVNGASLGTSSLDGSSVLSELATDNLQTLATDEIFAARAGRARRLVRFQ